MSISLSFGKTHFFKEEKSLILLSSNINIFINYLAQETEDYYNLRSEAFQYCKFSYYLIFSNYMKILKKSYFRFGKFIKVMVFSMLWFLFNAIL